MCLPACLITETDTVNDMTQLYQGVINVKEGTSCVQGFRSRQNATMSFLFCIVCRWREGQGESTENQKAPVVSFIFREIIQF